MEQYNNISRKQESTVWWMPDKKARKQVAKHVISFLFLSLILFAVALPLIQAQAQGIVPDGSTTVNNDSVMKKESGAYELSDFTVLMVNVAQWILGISGSLALLAFVVGGVLFLISAGSREKVEQAKKILSGAVIGLAIVFFSYIVINFILSTVFPKYSENFGPWNEAPTTPTAPPVPARPNSYQP